MILLVSSAYLELWLFLSLILKEFSELGESFRVYTPVCSITSKIYTEVQHRPNFASLLGNFVKTVLFHCNFGTGLFSRSPISPRS